MTAIEVTREVNEVEVNPQVNEVEVNPQVNDIEIASIGTIIYQGNGDLNAQFSFTNLSNQTFLHNFGGVNKFPSVTVIDDNNEVQVVCIDYVSPNAVRLRCNVPFDGTVYFN